MTGIITRLARRDISHSHGELGIMLISDVTWIDCTQPVIITKAKLCDSNTRAVSLRSDVSQRKRGAITKSQARLQRKQ
jgi:hypothetical protein